MNNRTVSMLVASIVVGTGSDGALAQQDCLSWVNRSVTGQGPLDGAGGVLSWYDSRLGMVFVLTDGGGTPTTWQWDGTAWSIKTQVNSPPTVVPALQFDVVFDSVRGRSVYVYAEQVWEFNGVAWTNRVDKPFPGAGIFDYDMAYDSARGVVVYFGGDPASTSGPGLNQTWEYDGESWTLRTLPNSPPARHAHRICYDSDRGVVVLFGGKTGGTYFNDTWEYDGATWTERGANAPIKPAARTFFAMDYDAARQMTVLHGGVVPGTTISKDVWEWDGAQWRQRVPAIMGGADDNRLRHTLIAHEVRGTTLLVGGPGTDQSHMIAELTSPNPISIYDDPDSQVVTAGDPVQFTVGAEGQTDLTYQWRHDGQPIPGATFSIYIIPKATGADQGAYDCIVGYAGFEPFGAPTTTSAPAMLSVTEGCSADLNSDGGVNSHDLANLLAVWGQCPG